MIDNPERDRNSQRIGDRRQILLHLEAGLIKNLKKAAVDLDSSASSVASEALDEWLKPKGFRLTADRQ